MKYQSVLHMFMHDFGKYLKEKGISEGGNKGIEIWNVNTSNLDVKEIIRLNRELGINKINYYGNKNKIKSK